MSWMKSVLPILLHRQEKSPEQPTKERNEKARPTFKIGDRVCFHRNIGDDSVCGIGIIRKLKSTPVMMNGKIASFTYVADIQPVYVPPIGWELRLVGDAAHASDDPIITFPLPVVAILLGRLGIRTKLQEDAGRYEVLHAVPGEYFCRADYHEALRLCCGEDLSALSVRVW